MDALFATNVDDTSLLPMIVTVFDFNYFFVLDHFLLFLVI